MKAFKISTSQKNQFSTHERVPSSTLDRDGTHVIKRCCMSDTARRCGTRRIVHFVGTPPRRFRRHHFVLDWRNTLNRVARSSRILAPKHMQDLSQLIAWMSCKRFYRRVSRRDAPGDLSSHGLLSGFLVCRYRRWWKTYHPGGNDYA